MADGLEGGGCLVAVLAPLGRHLVPYAPHYYGRAVAEMPHEVHYVLLRPFIEESVVAVLAFRLVPLVESLGHHHHTHLVAEFHKVFRRHIVRCSDGVAAHLLEHLNLMTERSPVHGRSERPEVVVHAHSVNNPAFPVEEKSPVGDKLDCTQPEAVFDAVNEFPVLQNACPCRVERRVLRRPEFRRCYAYVLPHSLAVAYAPSVGAPCRLIA